MTAFLFGVLWVVIGIHVMSFIADRYASELDQVIGEIGECWQGSLRGWIAVLLWPLTALMVYVTVRLEWFSDGDF